MLSFSPFCTPRASHQKINLISTYFNLENLGKFSRGETRPLRVNLTNFEGIFFSNHIKSSS